MVSSKMDRITSLTCRSLRLYWQTVPPRGGGDQRGLGLGRRRRQQRDGRRVRRGRCDRLCDGGWHPPPAPPRAVVRRRLLSRDDDPPLLLLLPS